MKLPHINAAKRKLTTKDISSEAARLIFQRYEADFDLFQYPRYALEAESQSRNALGYFS